MAVTGPVVLILGSGPNVALAADWPKSWFDRIVVMNNAWRVRPDWDMLVFPEDFDMDRMPPHPSAQQQLIEAGDFVPAQNAYGGFVHAGATMAYTTAYWALARVRPSVIAFMGCDMVYPKQGDTHFYGTGTADPLRDDVTLRDLGAKSARLALIAAAQGCACVNLSQDPSSLLLPRAKPDALRAVGPIVDLDRELYRALRTQEDALGYVTPDGRYDVSGKGMDITRLDAIDLAWRELYRPDAR
jgi:hypothetical protein